MRLLLLFSFVLTGCVFTGVSSEERLRDAVVGINDEVRWNRLDLAVQRVAPTYRGQFRATHHDWHRSFEIADSEIIHVEVANEHETAMSLVTVRWYDHATMLLAETTLRQRWQKVRGGYVLTEEEVADGNARLLEIPEALQIDASEEEETEEEEEEGAVAVR